MATWRTANSLLAYRRQLNTAFPGRNAASDGFIGDAAHASRTSDHNPWFIVNGTGIVTAGDFTHDPAHGTDMHKCSAALVDSNDPRLKYIIWNRRIWTPGIGWKPYNGTNPHTKHMHVSIDADARTIDDERPWALPGAAPAPLPIKPPAGAAQSPDPKASPIAFQRWYNGYPFSPALLPVIKPLANAWGPQSDLALKKVQARYGLEADGIAGPMTRALLARLGYRG